ncbi:MAG: DUF3108 domain-containing protein [Gammaproteobacteria bacterium]|nr:DUF3108 domain-containing protein [Gammaproteobacteria bacterium]MBU1978253.1 DUF3108 domain-containing protein [Gammaproteobacteria bacterium]
MPDRVKILLWVLGLSLAAHLALLLGPHFSLPVNLAPAPVLEARLNPPPPSSARLAKPKPPRASQPKPKPVKKTSAPPVEATPAPEVQPHTTAPPLAETPPPAVEPEPTVPDSPTMPQRVTTRFTVFKGLNGIRVGRAEQVWKLDGERYTISSIAEASGLFSLFATGKFVQESQGEITPAGLKPSNYRVERGKGGADKTDTAQFDWNAMTLTLASGGSKQTLKLPEGTQDLLSFMYQLAFAPPQSSTVKLQMTNGRKLDGYAYWVVEEALETPMGVLNTLHLGKHREEGEKDTEVWLAADYHYLPVKISQIDKDGDGLVLLANEIELTP